MKMFKITKQNFGKYLVGFCLIILFIIYSVQYGMLVGIMMTIVLITTGVSMSCLLPWIESNLPDESKKENDRNKDKKGIGKISGREKM